MAYDKGIEDRIQKAVARWKHTKDKKMFGGVCHLINGNMFCGVRDDYLILRLGVEQADKALQKEHVEPFDITGKPMKGWVMVSRAGFEDDKKLKDWLNQAKDFVKTLPAK